MSLCRYQTSNPADTRQHYHKSEQHFITPSKHVKNLGVYMDQYMSFEVHIHEIHKNVMGILLLVNRIRDKFDAATRKIVIQSLAQSGVQIYGSVVWYPPNCWSGTDKETLSFI